MNVDYVGPLNLGTTFEFTMLDLAIKVVLFTKSKSKIKFVSLPQDDPKQRRPDNTKAKKILNWEPKISLEEGLNKTIEYFSDRLNLFQE